MAVGVLAPQPVSTLLMAAAATLGLAAAVAGCASVPTFQDDRPRSSVVKLDGVEIRSDAVLTERDALCEQLATLRIRVSHALRLDPGSRPVVVYLFGDQQRYANYMAEHFPGLPSRRAFFVGKPGELAVYAFWGANIEADLRHECTHGFLHSCLGEVPLWLDEGLAEYFETAPTDPRLINAEHTKRLGLALRNGWRPDLARLEQLETVDQMQRADYQEAWAWVHFLMHESPAGRDLLVDYLHALPGQQTPPPLSQAVAEVLPSADRRLTAYLGSLTTATR